jgi:hypothetical protein
MRVEGQPAITLADEAIATLRAEVRSLLGLIDTTRRPEPTGIVPPPRRNPGAVWKLRGQWSVRTISDDDAPGEYVYVTTSQHWDGDFEAFPIEDARALAMSLLAACEWAERGDPPDRRRYPELDEDIVPTGRSFICGPLPSPGVQ